LGQDGKGFGTIHVFIFITAAKFFH
jgi:hypothetical protein